MELSLEYCVLTTILSIGFVLHILGIYCLHREKRKLKNQKIVLMNLSAVEMVSILFMAVHLNMDKSSSTMDEKSAEVANEILCTVYHVITNLFYQTMILIPLDRLVCMLHPAFYFTQVRVSTMKKIVLTIWTSSILASVPFALLLDVATHTKFILYSSYLAQAIFVVVSVCAYTLVVRYQHSRRRLFAQSFKSSTIGQQEVEGNQRIVVPFVLSMSFVVFYIAPNYMSQLTGWNTAPLHLVLTGISYVGLLVDPIVYTLMHRDIRPILRTLFTYDVRLKRSISDRKDIENEVELKALISVEKRKLCRQ